MALSADKKVLLHNLADRGDVVAQAFLDSSKDVVLTAGVEGAGAANSIDVTGQIVDGMGYPVAGVQDVLLTSVPVSGAGTTTVITGTAKFGSASKQVWLQTDATGKFVARVLNAAVEDNLVLVQTGNGDTAALKITFA
jgi:hypothetical protein